MDSLRRDLEERGRVVREVGFCAIGGLDGVDKFLL